MRKLSIFLLSSLYAQLLLAGVTVVTLFVTRGRDDFSAFYAIYPMLAFVGLGLVNMVAMAAYLLQIYRNKAMISWHIMVVAVVVLLILILFMMGKLSSSIGLS